MCTVYSQLPTHSRIVISAVLETGTVPLLEKPRERGTSSKIATVYFLILLLGLAWLTI